MFKLASEVAHAEVAEKTSTLTSKAQRNFIDLPPWGVMSRQHRVQPGFPQHVRFPSYCCSGTLKIRNLPEELARIRAALWPYRRKKFSFIGTAPATPVLGPRTSAKGRFRLHWPGLRRRILLPRGLLVPSASMWVRRNT